MGAWWGGREKPPSTRRTAADGGVGHRTEKALCPGGKLAQAEWFLSIRKTTIFELIGWLKRESAECRLHPLIYTRLEFTLAQDIGREADTRKARISPGKLAQTPCQEDIASILEEILHFTAPCSSQLAASNVL